MGAISSSLRGAVGLAAVAVACACAAAPAVAAESASATFSSTQLSATSWQYDLTLSDTGTTNLGTFWFAWVPGQNFMGVAPSGITSPAGWTAKTTHGGATDGYAIQWVAAPAAQLTPGESLTGFTFDSALSPEQMLGDSPFHPTSPVTTTFVYSGAPFSDAGFKFEVSAVPEPSSLALLGLGALAVVVALARKRSGRHRGSLLSVGPRRAIRAA